ncbi:MAG: hypothetical protein JWP55_3072 [Mycobacterium sp.]|nr:hypothetical protein [Mycobacterium sp.]
MSVSVLVTVPGVTVSVSTGAGAPPPPPEDCSRWLVAVVVVGVVVVVVVVVVGAVVPVELHATDSPPTSTAVAIPVTAAHRREVVFTNVIHTQVSCESNCGAGVRNRTASCQPRGLTPFGPSVDAAYVPTAKATAGPVMASASTFTLPTTSRDVR